MEAEFTQLLLRLPVQLKAALQVEADRQGRKLTQEVNIRLRESLGMVHGPTLTSILERERLGLPLRPTAVNKGAPEGQDTTTAEETMHPADALMLDLWRRLTPEKKLALLSLLR